jgi:hypothetical protein
VNQFHALTNGLLDDVEELEPDELLWLPLLLASGAVLGPAI